MQNIQTIGLDEALLLIELAREKAEKIGSPSNIAVVDAFGYLLAHIRMNEAQLPSIEHAIHKAKTSALFHKPTIDLKKDAEPKGGLYGLNNTLSNSVIVFAGGMPLKKQGNVVGAIGISGGTPEQDQQIAEHAIKNLKLK